MPQPSPARPDTRSSGPRGWYRWSLRGLLLLTTLFCVLMGAWSLYVRPYARQAAVIDTLAPLQATIQAYDVGGGRLHEWLVTLALGPERFVHVTSVVLPGAKVTDDTLLDIVDLVYLKELRIDRAKVSSEAVAALASLRRLEILSLRYTAIDDPAVEALSRLPRLRKLYLTGTLTSDAAVESLARLASLKDLFIRYTAITNEGVAALKQALPGCAVHHHVIKPVSPRTDTGRGEASG